MSEPRDLRDLVGDDVPEAELALLRTADEAMRRTTSPPEASLSLTQRVLAIPSSSRRGGRLRPLAAVAAAAAIAGAAFGIGWWASGSDGGPPIMEAITLNPTPEAPPDAQMVIDVLARDDAGNWPMLADVHGLQALPEGGFYEVWLTEDGKAVSSCGRFVVGPDGTANDVWLNAPYKLKGYERWVVMAHEPGGGDSPWLLDGPVVVPA